MNNASKPDFYIQENECICCRAPEAVAPELIGFHEDVDPGKSHCYLKKQPSDPYEISKMVKAVEANCCGTFRYRGRDKGIRRKLGFGNIDPLS